MHSLYLLLLFLSLTSVAMPTTRIGVTYSTPGSTSDSVPISPKRIVAYVVYMKFQAVRLLDPNPEMIRAFANTNVSLFLSVPNSVTPLLASDRSFTLDWVSRHVLPFHTRSNISIISVGNDVITSGSPDFSPLLLPAMKNVRRSLVHLRIHSVSVSTTFSFFSIIQPDFPSSPAQFTQPNGELILKPILQFLERTNSSFLINLHPYHFDESSFLISIGCGAPFRFKSHLSSTGIRYDNVFDLMVDAVIASMTVMGHTNLPVIVAETGWPSSGINASEVDATLRCSEMFLRELITHLRKGRGTPLRKEGAVEVYIFELVDKEGQGVRNWGLLYPNLTIKYTPPLMGHEDISLVTILLIGLYFVLFCFTTIRLFSRPPAPRQRPWTD